ncbi:glycoside hydrolase family 88 protein [Butyrivibrio sp. VCD2006]|uniref:glycoside hydrolase family 88 protein n=1 Tax=Butyrivibrio sp. VCD2006 TaxID=1280664 RepID=UPI00041D5FEF|nr:glycoside hydrolase family 88 protein [Butyrivibrio sp. VCD2006]
MNKETLEQIIRVTENDLSSINNYTAKDALKDAAKKALKRATTNRDPMFWPAGLLLLGLTEAAFSPSKEVSSLISTEIRDEAVDHVTSYLDRWLKAGENVSYVDDSLAGLSLITLYENTGEKRFHHGAIKIANFLAQCPKNKEESIIYNPSKGNDLIYADGAGQTAMYLSRYASYFGKKNAMALAAKQLLNFHENGFDERSALPYHAFSLEKGKKLGIIGWGRAVGWLMMGYSELLASLERESFHGNNIANESLLKNTADKLMSQYYNLVRVTLSYQRPDGGYSWLLPAIDGEADTSATAMISYSMSSWLRSGAFHAHAKDLTEDVKKAVAGAGEFLLANTKNGSVLQSLSSCEDIAVHRQVYGHYPWGQGSTLALLSILD